MTNLKTMRDIENNEGRKVRVRLNGETFEATIVKGEFETCGGKVRGAEGVHSLRYDHERGLCSYWSPFDETFFNRYQVGECELLGTKLDKHNIPYNIGKRVIYKMDGRIDKGTLVQGSFTDCEGEYREFEEDVISIRYDKPSEAGTLIFSDVDTMLGVIAKFGGSLKLETKPTLKIGQVVCITSDTIRDIMEEEELHLPYGIFKGYRDICGDEMLRVGGVEPSHSADWLVFEDRVKPLEPAKDLETGDLILVKVWNDELVVGTFVESGKYYFDGGELKQAWKDFYITSDNREIVLNNMNKVYRVEEVL